MNINYTRKVFVFLSTAIFTIGYQFLQCGLGFINQVKLSSKTKKLKIQSFTHLSSLIPQ